ncbi:hypothetical protein J2S09_000999 [Bacillus fengqiuensis]|nr:hypothetical protein [Bacillus fengqiuensis]
MKIQENQIFATGLLSLINGQENPIDGSFLYKKCGSITDLCIRSTIYLAAKPLTSRFFKRFIHLFKATLNGD